MLRIGISPRRFPTRAARQKRFADVGQKVHQCVREVVPHRDGQAILDFGCGSGRVLKWFASEPELRLTACDIHSPSIEWMQASFPGSIRLYASDESPPLPEADDTFDLIHCSSVFSHLTNWAPWLLELRRVLKPDGVLVASLHGRGLWAVGVHGSRGAAWDEDRTGILVEYFGDSFDQGWGPAVYVSEWWLREHWGRALDIQRFEATGFGMPHNPSSGQAWVVARKPHATGRLTSADLEAPATDERELAAALRGRQLAYEEVGYVRAETSDLRDGYAKLNERCEELLVANAALARKLAMLERSTRST